MPSDIPPQWFLKPELLEHFLQSIRFLLFIVVITQGNFLGRTILNRNHMASRDLTNFLYKKTISSEMLLLETVNIDFNPF